MPKSLHTIGYEKLDFHEFVRRIEDVKVKTLVDVREYPKSRKKGFSKNEMASYFQKNGIKYIHIKELGSPSKLRKKVRSDGNYSYFFRKYMDYLIKQNNALESLTTLINEDNTCIFCYEDDILECHRKSIAAYLNVLNGEEFQIIHL